MGTLTPKDNLLTLTAATIEDNMSLIMFEDFYCSKVDEEHWIMIRFVASLPFEIVPDVSRCYCWHWMTYHSHLYRLLRCIFLCNYLILFFPIYIQNLHIHNIRIRFQFLSIEMIVVIWKWHRIFDFNQIS